MKPVALSKWLCTTIFLFTLVLVQSLRWSFDGTDIWTKLSKRSASRPESLTSYSYDPGPWCEQERTADFLREPSNALSDFAFLAVGLYMIHHSFVDYGHSLVRTELGFQAATRRGGAAPPPATGLMREFPFISFLWGVVNIVHFVGTFSNHASRTHLAHVLDVIGMCSVEWFRAVYLIVRVLDLQYSVRKNLNHYILGSSVVFMLGMVVIVRFSDLHYANADCGQREVLMLGSLITLSVVCLVTYAVRTRTYMEHNNHALAVSVGLLLVGVGFHRADLAKIGCYPTSIFQLHALWHLMTAGALLCGYHYLRSETSARQKRV